MNKKTVQDYEMIIESNEEAKIVSIQDATSKLIEVKGYEKVTIPDIAELANVSINQLYKYFPGGKFYIIKEIGHQYMDELLMIKQPNNVDFNDFPGYMREVIKNLQQLYKDNSSLMKALTMAALNDGEIVDEVRKIDLKDYEIAAEFFSRFNNVSTDNKNPLELLMYWGIMVKGIIFLTIIYPVPIMNDKVLTDLMVDLSLNIWGYHKVP